jgi:hypothetical protein
MKELIIFIVAAHCLYEAIKEYKIESIFIKEHIRRYGWEGRTYSGRNSALGAAVWAACCVWCIDIFALFIIVKVIEWLTK